MFFQSAYAGTIAIPQASTVAVGVDQVNDFIFWLSVFFTIAIPATMLVFIVKYHRSNKGRRTEQLDHSTALEVIWTLIPFVLMMIIFGWGWVEYKKMKAPVANALEINVIGRQWLWNFQYPNGRQAMNDVVIPLNKPVKFIMTSEDVLHSFYVPNFRNKQDVVPGMYTSLYVVATMTGVHKIYCAEYCGTSHSDMLGRVIVVPEAEYNAFLETGKMPELASSDALTMPYRQSSSGSGASKSDSTSSAVLKAPHERGKELYASKGCVACHSADGSAKVGPSFKGAFGHEVELVDGQKVTVDENYLRESIENSQAKVVKGYAPSMPLYKGTLTDQEVGSLIAYIKSLK